MTIRPIHTATISRSLPDLDLDSFELPLLLRAPPLPKGVLHNGQRAYFTISISYIDTSWHTNASRHSDTTSCTNADTEDGTAEVCRHDRLRVGREVQGTFYVQESDGCVLHSHTALFRIVEIPLRWRTRAQRFDSSRGKSAQRHVRGHVSRCSH